MLKIKRARNDDKAQPAGNVVGLYSALAGYPYRVVGRYQAGDPLQASWSVAGGGRRISRRIHNQCIQQYAENPRGERSCGKAIEACMPMVYRALHLVEAKVALAAPWEELLRRIADFIIQHDGSQNEHEHDISVECLCKLVTYFFPRNYILQRNGVGFTRHARQLFALMMCDVTRKEDGPYQGDASRYHAWFAKPAIRDPAQVPSDADTLAHIPELMSLVPWARPFKDTNQWAAALQAVAGSLSTKSSITALQSTLMGAAIATGAMFAAEPFKERTDILASAEAPSDRQPSLARPVNPFDTQLIANVFHRMRHDAQPGGKFKCQRPATLPQAVDAVAEAWRRVCTDLHTMGCDTYDPSDNPAQLTKLLKGVNLLDQIMTAVVEPCRPCEVMAGVHLLAYVLVDVTDARHASAEGMWMPAEALGVLHMMDPMTFFKVQHVLVRAGKGKAKQTKAGRGMRLANASFSFVPLAVPVPMLNVALARAYWFYTSIAAARLHLSQGADAHAVYKRSKDKTRVPEGTAEGQPAAKKPKLTVAEELLGLGQGMAMNYLGVKQTANSGCVVVMPMTSAHVGGTTRKRGKSKATQAQAPVPAEEARIGEATDLDVDDEMDDLGESRRPEKLESCTGYWLRYEMAMAAVAYGKLRIIQAVADRMGHTPVQTKEDFKDGKPTIKRYATNSSTLSLAALTNVRNKGWVRHLHGLQSAEAYDRALEVHRTLAAAAQSFEALFKERHARASIDREQLGDLRQAIAAICKLRGIQLPNAAPVAIGAGSAADIKCIVDVIKRRSRLPASEVGANADRDWEASRPFELLHRMRLPAPTSDKLALYAAVPGGLFKRTC